MNTGQIIKSKLTDRFTTIPNEFLRRPDLSLKAKGLLCTLLSLPSDWAVSKKQLTTLMSDGYDSMKTAFDELEKNGYILSVRVIDPETRQFKGFNYVVYDTPATPEAGDTVGPIRDFPEQGFPEQENPDLLNKEYTKKEFTNTDSTLTGTILPTEPAKDEKKAEPVKNPPAKGGKNTPLVAPPPPQEKFYKKEYQDLIAAIPEGSKPSAYAEAIKTFLEKYPAWPHPEPYVDLWNIFANKYRLAQVQALNETRKRKIEIRSKEPQFRFYDILKAMGASAFLTGDGWKTTFDWLIENDTNYLKTLEGNYK